MSVRMVAGAEEPCGYERAVQDWWQADPGVKLGTFDEAARSGEALVFEIVR